MASREETVRVEIEAVAVRHLGLSERLQPEMRLVEDLGLDSVGLLTLAVEVENRLRVALSPEEEASIRTVGDLTRILAAKLDD